MMIIRWTTPTIEFKVPGVDLTGTTCWLTLKQGNRSIDISVSPTYDSSANESSFDVKLSQQQTGSLKPNVVAIMLNVIDSEGDRFASDPLIDKVFDNLLDRAVS